MGRNGKSLAQVAYPVPLTRPYPFPNPSPVPLAPLHHPLSCPLHAAAGGDSIQIQVTLRYPLSPLSFESSRLVTVGEGEKGRRSRHRPPPMACGPSGGGGDLGAFDVCCSGPSRSRSSCPCAAGEAMAAAAALLWNKSSRSLPRPGGVPLRRHRRARGGGASRRSPASIFLRLLWVAEVRGFCSKVA